MLQERIISICLLVINNNWCWLILFGLNILLNLVLALLQTKLVNLILDAFLATHTRRGHLHIDQMPHITKRLILHGVNNIPALLIHFLQLVLPIRKHFLKIQRDKPNACDSLTSIDCH